MHTTKPHTIITIIIIIIIIIIVTNNTFINNSDSIFCILHSYSLNTGSDHRMVRGKARINTKFERAKMVAQPKKVDTGKLQHHRREFQVEQH